MIRKVASCIAAASMAFLSTGTPVSAATAQSNATSVAKSGDAHILASGVSGAAFVQADGTLGRSINAVSSASIIDAGGYEVIFNSRVDKCWYTATTGNATASDPLPYAIAVSPRGKNPKGVYVHITDLTGAPHPSGFFLNVTC